MLYSTTLKKSPTYNANLVTIYCCNRVIRSVQRNDVLNEIAKILRKGGK